MPPRPRKNLENIEEKSEIMKFLELYVPQGNSLFLNELFQCIMFRFVMTKDVVFLYHQIFAHCKPGTPHYCLCYFLSQKNQESIRHSLSTFRLFTCDISNE